VSVSLDDVRHIAELARIGVPDERLPVLARELSGILDQLAVLDRADITAVGGAAELPATAWRLDQGPPIPLLRPLPDFAPEIRDGFFIVPRLATHGGQSSDDEMTDGAS
jgi:aspartyl-tRNA(Asn)/glutamyl-tRNA(Gln) amidotransferase subunit C